MNKTNIKLIMELIFIFILPLIFIAITSEKTIQREFEVENTENLPTNETKSITFNNSIIKYSDGFKNVINNFNIWDEQWNDNTALDTNGNEFSINGFSTTSLIEINDNIIYIKIDASNNELSACVLVYYDNTNNVIDYGQIQVNQNWANTPITIPSGTKYIKFYVPNAYKNKINVNYSITWANGNYVPYGEPLILITSTDISGQNKINYTIWGNIKNLLITNLELNDNVLLNLILCYTILWFIMWIIWHLYYGLFELLWHVIPKPLERMK